MMMMYKVEFTTLAKYASHVVSTLEKKCYHFLRGIRDNLRHLLIIFCIKAFSELVERARLIYNDLSVT